MEAERNYLANFFFVVGIAVMSGPGLIFLDIMKDLALVGKSEWMTLLGWLIIPFVLAMGVFIVLIGYNILFEAEEESNI